MPNVSFMAPGSELELAQQDAARQRAMADALRQQSMEPSQGRMVGNYYAAPSWTQGLAKVLAGFGARSVGDKADEGLRTARGKYDASTQNEVQQFVDNLRGKPAQSFQTGGNEMGDEAATQTTPAQSPDMNKAMMTALSSQNPMIQGMGGNILNTQVQNDMTQQMLAKALQQFGGASAVTGAPAAAGAPTDGAQPQGAPQQGGIPGVSPMAAALTMSGNPTLGNLGKMAQDAFAEGNKPVINRGYGMGRMVNGQYVPDAASLAQALAMEQGKQNITAPMETPVTIDLSSGQKAQLSRPEYAQFQKSGQLPARYGQGPAAGPAPAASAGGYRTEADARAQASAPMGLNPQALDREIKATTADLNKPMDPGSKAQLSAHLADLQKTKDSLGVPGLTQSQPDQIEQEGAVNFAKKVADESAQSLLAQRDKARAASDDLMSITEARKSIANGVYGGSGADAKLAVAKFINANIPGITIDEKKVGNTDYMKSTLGSGLLAQAKALGANPSNADAERINDIVGSIGKDPAAMQKILDWREKMARRSIEIHNNNVQDAETRGMKSPFDLRIKPPAAAVAGSGFKIIGVN